MVDQQRVHDNRVTISDRLQLFEQAEELIMIEAPQAPSLHRGCQSIHGGAHCGRCGPHVSEIGRVEVFLGIGWVGSLKGRALGRDVATDLVAVTRGVGQGWDSLQRRTAEHDGAQLEVGRRLFMS